MNRYRVAWPMVSGIRTSGMNSNGSSLSVSAYAGDPLPADVLPEEIDRLLADGAIELDPAATAGQVR